MKLELELNPELEARLKQVAEERDWPLEDVAILALDEALFGKPTTGAEIIAFWDRNNLRDPNFGGDVDAPELVRQWRDEQTKRSREKFARIAPQTSAASDQDAA